MSIISSNSHVEGFYDTYQQKSGSTCSTPITTAPPMQTIQLYDFRDGVKNPNWKREVAAGRNATTPFSAERQTLETTPATTDTWWLAAFPEQPSNWRRERKTWSHDIGTFALTLPPISDLNVADNKAQTRFYKELEGALTSFQGGVFLGELRETLQMIRNPARTLRGRIDDYLSRLKKRRRGSPTTKKKILADSWLEASFGWLPLLHDLNAAKDYHTKRVELLKQELVPLQGSSVQETVSDVSTGHFSGQRLLLARALSRKRSFVRYLGAVASEAIGNQVMTMDALGLSPRAFVPTVWELLPWSFAIDYFTNIGDVLTAWANQRTRLAWLCKTTRREMQVASYGPYAYGFTATPAKLYADTFTGGRSTASYTQVGRSSSSYVPVPSIQFEIPGFGKKWLNLAALAANRRALTPY